MSGGAGGQCDGHRLQGCSTVCACACGSPMDRQLQLQAQCVSELCRGQGNTHPVSPAAGRRSFRARCPACSAHSMPLLPHTTVPPPPLRWAWPQAPPSTQPTASSARWSGGACRQQRLVLRQSLRRRKRESGGALADWCSNDLDFDSFAPCFSCNSTCPPGNAAIAGIAAI